jgi:polysaccharide export outer membrane protein
MFTVPQGAALGKKVADAERNYVIAKNDQLQLQVYTNKGERIVDPDFELSKETGSTSTTIKKELTYVVDVNGIAKLPLVGELKVEGLTIRQAEDILQKEYAKFYNDSFVVLTFANKRVIVLGAPGGMVIPLVNENTRLVEVLALAKGIDKFGKAHNIRVLRGNEVFLVDLSTFEGYQKNNLIMEPNDIVYVEPVRRSFSEGVQEYGPALSLITSLTTLIVVITTAND